MKIGVQCNTCISNNMLQNHDYLIVRPRSDGIYQTECSRGHKSTLLMDEEHFQVLYEYGVNALKDGYFREAVSSFAAALERFFQYSIEVLSANTAIDETSHLNAWKSVANSSERQLGAFVYLFLSHVGREPQLLTRKNTEFRNDVVHKGHFPLAEEATAFGEVIRQVILLNYEPLKIKYWNAIQAKKVKRQQDYHLRIGPKAMSGYFGISMHLGLKEGKYITPLAESIVK